MIRGICRRCFGPSMPVLREELTDLGCRCSIRVSSLRDKVPLTRHIHTFGMPEASSTASNRLNGNKALLREKVLEMRQRGMSCRQIADAVGLHWTRVGQIVREHNETENKNDHPGADGDRYPLK